MRKAIKSLMVMMLLGLAAVCHASPESKLMAKEQAATNNFFKGLTAEELNYENATADLLPEVKQKLTLKEFTGMRRTVKEQLGALEQTTFKSFERETASDKVVLQGKFTKAENVQMVGDFDKDGHLVNFHFIVIKPQVQE